MPNVERLRLLDEEKEFNVCGITGKILGIELSNRDYSFLYGEAVRAQDLAKENQRILEVDKEKTEVLYHSYDEIARLREALSAIRWNSFATNPQAMIMKDIARRALEDQPCTSKKFLNE